MSAGIRPVCVLSRRLRSQAAYVITIDGPEGGRHGHPRQVRRRDHPDDRAGHTDVLPRASILKAVADKPAGDRQGGAAGPEAKQYDEAIKLLEDVSLRYRFLDWDNQARAMLPKVYMIEGRFRGRRHRLRQAVRRMRPRARKTPRCSGPTGRRCWTPSSTTSWNSS